MEAPDNHLDWSLIHEDASAGGSISHLKMLRNDGISAVSLDSGDIDASTDPATGIYFRDTRHLSRLRFSLGGVAPRLLDAKLLPNALSAVFTNPPLTLPDGTRLHGQQLVVRRRRVVDRSVFEVLTVSNYAAQALRVEVRLSIDADFRDIFEVRGFRRKSPDPRVEAESAPETIRFSALGADGVERSVTLRLSPPAARVSPGEATFFLDLQPRETAAISIEIAIAGEATGLDPLGAASRVEAAQRRWLDSITGIETDDETVNGAISRALVDIFSLRTSFAGYDFTAAGVPWFDALFGRDSLITGIELAAVAPEVLRRALIVLANYQAKASDPSRDAEPGKIPHELRWGELAGTGEVPFGAYYGSVDATPLFVLAASEYLRWTGDEALIADIQEEIEAALTWCQTAEEHGNGFLTYEMRSPHGLEHQGWKDSRDGICWPEGADVATPIALVEAQGYLAAAYAAGADLFEAANPALAARLRSRAGEVVARIEERMTHPDLGYVLCLDGEGRPVPTPASNAGHLLWVGAAREDCARRAASTLMSSDLFTGWGIRTLGMSATRYNPLGYHTGSVWPHDNAIILAGLRRYGFDREAGRLGAAMLEAVVRFQDMQVPELFSGDARELRLVPTPYPVSSRPQAWSAAAVPYLLVSMLGIRPLSDGRITVIRPILPAGLEWVRLHNLRRGEGTADLLFRRDGEHVAVEVERMRGGMEVVLSNSFPDPLLGAPPAARRPSFL